MNGPMDIVQDIIAAQGDVILHVLKRMGWRAVWAIACGVFLVFAAFSLHGVVWTLFLACGLNVFFAALCVLGLDVLGALVCLLLAVRARRRRAAEEAARERRSRKWDELRQSIAFTAVINLILTPLGRLASDWVYGLFRRPGSGDAAEAPRESRPRSPGRGGFFFRRR